MHFHEAIVEVRRIVSDTLADVSEVRKLVEEIVNKPPPPPFTEEELARDILLAMIRGGAGVSLDSVSDAKRQAREFFTPSFIAEVRKIVEEKK